MTDLIKTGLGDFSIKKFDALVNIRAEALDAIRLELKQRQCTEVTTASLVNIAGSCENPQASFKVNYYGREAHLSQSSQVQLESLVMRLDRGFFTVNNSFREEHFDDPTAAGRRLSEFTLIEAEAPWKPFWTNQYTPKDALNALIEWETNLIRHTTARVIRNCEKDLVTLGSDPAKLEDSIFPRFGPRFGCRFPRITYDEALEILNRDSPKKYVFGDDLGIAEEQRLLAFADNQATFVTHHPASLKFFNMKRDGERTYSVDLLLPRLGEAIGGGVREENGARITEQLVGSKLGAYLTNLGQDPCTVFGEYLKVFEPQRMLRTDYALGMRSGFGIGFERYIGFLLQSNDILETIAYRTLRP